MSSQGNNRVPEQIQEKGVAVFRPELRENKELERFRVSMKNGNAIVQPGAWDPNPTGFAALFWFEVTGLLASSPGPRRPRRYLSTRDQLSFGLSSASIFGSFMFALVTRLAPVSTKVSTFSPFEAASAVLMPS